MSSVNLSLLNTGVVSSYLSSETIATGESGDVNQEFSKMLQYLRQGQSGKEDDEPKQSLAKEGLSKEHSTNFEAPMENLLGFLETFEGQVVKVSGLKSSEANAALAPVADKLTALAQFLNILQEKLNEGSGSAVEKVVTQADVGVGNLDLNELADLLKQVRFFFDQHTNLSQSPISSDKIKILPETNSKNDVLENGATIIAPDTTGLQRDDSGNPLAISKMKAYGVFEAKSQSLIAKGLSNTLSQIQVLVSKVKLATSGKNGEVIASDPDTSKVANIPAALKGIDLNKLFTNSDRSTATADISLDGINNPTIDEFMTILNKLKSEEGSLASIERPKVANVSVAKENVSEGPPLLELPMRTSDVVFASENNITSVAIKNLPQALRAITLPLEQLAEEISAADLSSEVAKVSGQHSITSVSTSAQSLKPISTKELIQTMETDAVSGADAAEKLHFKSPQQLTTQPVGQVAPKSPEQVVLKSPEQVVLKSPEQVVLKSPEQVVLKSPEQVVLKSPEQVVLKSPEQVVLKSPEQAAPKSPEQMTSKPPGYISPKSSEDLEAHVVKPFPEIVKKSAKSFPELDMSKINVEAKSVKVPIENTIQLDNETAVTNAKLNLGSTVKNNTVEVPDVTLKTAELAAFGKIEQNGSLQVAKDDMPAHQKTLQSNINFKNTDVIPQSKAVKVAIKDVNEVGPAVTTKRLEVSDTPKLMETSKAEPTLGSKPDKRAAYDIPKDNDNLEKSLSKMAEKVAVAKQAVPGQKAQHAQVQAADRFNIEPPKIRHHSTGENTTLGSKPVTDLVARTTQTFVAQQKGFLRKKMMGDASVMSSTVGVNADAATSQQIAASLGSQSQTGQGSSGSNMLEKWADSHLDLSSRGWATNMAKTMVSALNRGQERLMFSLSPPSLGRISIAFTSTRGALDVRIQAERKATIALLGDAEGKLTSNLESAGHRVNSLSYADMNSGEAKFNFDHNQNSNNENKGKNKNDSLKEEKTARLEANAEGSTVTNKKVDDSLVNITV